jgi:hypothetical protein
MKRFARSSTTIGLGGIVVLAAAVYGQAPPAPAPAPSPAANPATGFAAGELGNLTQQMAERVRQLGDAIAADLGNTPSGPTLIQDARELAQAIDEFRQLLPGVASALRGRQLYSGIDASWHYLLVQLGRPGGSSPKVEAAARRVGEIDAQIHRVLNANAYPAIYYGSKASPGGMPQIQSLAHALVDRAEALLSVVRADMRGPVGSRVAEEVTSLVQAADAFHDGINLDSRPDDITRNGFAGVTVASDLIAADLTAIGGQVPVSDRVRAAWKSFRTAELLMRQTLKLPPRLPEISVSVIPNNGPSPLLALANRLIEQLDDFLIVFTPEAKDVREGGSFIADARRLRGAAANFRDEIPRAIDVGQLAYAFRDVDALWQVLARRANRIAPGENGPNIQRLEIIWQTITEIHRMLGMPGFPTPVGPAAAPG